MKQQIILIIVLALLIVSGILENSYIEQSANYILGDLDYTENAVNNKNFEFAKANIQEVQNTWDNMKSTWAIFIDHEELDNIETALVNYKGYIYSLDEKMSTISSDELIMLFGHIKSRQSLKIENVF